MIMKFWIGDPCYNTIADDQGDWMDLLTKTNYFNNDGEVIVFKDRHIAAVSTMYGDGHYTSNLGYTFGVDAGLIGFCEWKEEDEGNEELTRLLTLMEFGEVPEISRDGNGTICITSSTQVIYIYTGDHEEGEDEDYDDYIDEDEYYDE